MNVMKIKPIVYAIIVCLAVLGGLLIGYVAGYKRATHASINSFEDCERAGFPVQESYPEVCVTSDGKRFVNNTAALPD